MANEPGVPTTRINYLRRGIGGTIAFSPFALLLTSAVFGRQWPSWTGVGIALSAIGLLIASFNLYLALRPAIYHWRHGSDDGFRNSSVIPGVGTLAVVLGGLLGFGDWRVCVVGCVALILDTGGFPWFVVATWHDRGFWDD